MKASKQIPTEQDLALINRYLADFDGKADWASAMIEAETGDFYLSELVLRVSAASEDHPASEAAFDWIN